MFAELSDYAQALFRCKHCGFTYLAILLVLVREWYVPLYEPFARYPTERHYRKEGPAYQSRLELYEFII